MIYEKIMLPTTASGAIPMDIYMPNVSHEIDSEIVRPTVIVCPGGGYEFTSEREGEPLALRLAAYGFNACVVWYRVKPDTFPAEYQDAASAVGYMRKHAQQYHVDTNRISIMGFSAGGHLAACLGTMWEEAELIAPLGYTPEDVKPNSMVLGYPVITYRFADERGITPRCFLNLTGSKDCADYERFSLDKRVSQSTPPTFIWSTWDDEIVPIQNSLVFADALQKNGVPAELHIFPHGAHGSSLSDDTVYKNRGDAVPELSCWIDLAIRFLKNL